MAYKRYPESYKASIIEEVKRGIKPQIQIAKETGIPPETLSRWANNVKKKQRKKIFTEPLFASEKSEKKDYSEMGFEELLDYLPSKENKSFAGHLNKQYRDKGIALRYCLVVLNPALEGGHCAKH